MISQYKFSKRQKQILVLLSRGMSNKDISAELNINEHTVKVHMWRLLKKMKVNSRMQALVVANNIGFFDGRHNLVHEMYEFIKNVRYLDSKDKIKKSYLIGKYDMFFHETLNSNELDVKYEK